VKDFFFLIDQTSGKTTE